MSDQQTASASLDQNGNKMAVNNSTQLSQMLVSQTKPSEQQEIQISSSQASLIQMPIAMPLTGVATMPLTLCTVDPSSNLDAASNQTAPASIVGQPGAVMGQPILTQPGIQTGGYILLNMPGGTTHGITAIPQIALPSNGSIQPASSQPMNDNQSTTTSMQQGYFPQFMHPSAPMAPPTAAYMLVPIQQVPPTNPPPTQMVQSNQQSTVLTPQHPQTTPNPQFPPTSQQFQVYQPPTIQGNPHPAPAAQPTTPVTPQTNPSPTPYQSHPITPQYQGNPLPPPSPQQQANPQMFQTNPHHSTPITPAPHPTQPPHQTNTQPPNKAVNDPHISSSVQDTGLSPVILLELQRLQSMASSSGNYTPEDVAKILRTITDITSSHKKDADSCTMSQQSQSNPGPSHESQPASPACISSTQPHVTSPLSSGAPSPLDHPQFTTNRVTETPVREKRKKGPAPKLDGNEVCLICGDKASGYHYGVLSCEGCKGFFRRCIIKSANFKCKAGGQCQMDTYMRRKCQRCRLDKCRAAGMKDESVLSEDHGKAKRLKREKEQNFVASPLHFAPNLSFTGEPIPSLTSQQHNLVEMLQANEARFQWPTQEAVAKVTPWVESGDSHRCRASRFAHFTELAILIVQLVVEFTKQLPGFLTVTRVDQILLLKACTIEVMLLRAAKQYDKKSKAINFLNGKFYDKSSFYRAGMQVEFVDPIFDFCNSMAQLGLDEAEYALLVAINTFSADRPNIKDIGKVEAVQNSYVELLRVYLKIHHPSDPLMFPRTLMKLVELRTLNNYHSEQIFALKVQDKQLPPLLAEIWDM